MKIKINFKFSLLDLEFFFPIQINALSTLNLNEYINSHKYKFKNSLKYTFKIFPIEKYLNV